jgi:hypothetical protein
MKTPSAHLPQWNFLLVSDEAQRIYATCYASLIIGIRFKKTETEFKPHSPYASSGSAANVVDIITDKRA